MHWVHKQSFFQQVVKWGNNQPLTAVLVHYNSLPSSANYKEFLAALGHLHQQLSLLKTSKVPILPSPACKQYPGSFWATCTNTTSVSLSNISSQVAEVNEDEIKSQL